ILIHSEIGSQLSSVIDALKPGKIFMLTDDITRQHCLPSFDELLKREKVHVLGIGQGESEKVIDTVIKIWNFLQQQGADRESLVINLGGGMLLDIGGFAASTFKRGVKFVNIPTTLLSMVDASVGGKTGVNLNDYKNHVGTFSQPQYVLISPVFLKTLDIRQIYAGWAEMLKHGLIRSENHLHQLLSVKPEEVDEEALTGLIYESVEIKNYFVQNDPYETHMRKVLNFGHTIGHAFESMAFSGQQSLLHGEAVANGLICELYLSAKWYHPDKQTIKHVTDYIRNNYLPVRISVENLDEVYKFLLQDKKNTGNKVNFTLLRYIGDPLTDQYISRKTIEEALTFYINEYD
ncbi:MAG: 3-dehydroquinate synthase, partial [Bacteroidales bacterium]|nr:3-dehydroquinate synthase [Bacteroidales bacterium]